ncbi:hypothetical protein CEXT_484311 [Caerostris extrusa]|uniref:Uncharacterized protein n=1 Tax=Caerostris extrusa TaxID=172846 RepID=A0AAV4Y440_CAEEX|nr:hypothetical protein CEXT_484311 [Caerostris extrusa]
MLEEGGWGHRPLQGQGPLRDPKSRQQLDGNLRRHAIRIFRIIVFLRNPEKINSLFFHFFPFSLFLCDRVVDPAGWQCKKTCIALFV